AGNAYFLAAKEAERSAREEQARAAAYGDVVEIQHRKATLQYNKGGTRFGRFLREAARAGDSVRPCCQVTLLRMFTNARRVAAPTLAAASAAALVGCGDMARLPVESGMGPKPVLPEPQKSLIPTVNVATAESWADGAKPAPAPGLSVNAYAADL